jgi:hypothetical protein
MYMLLRPRFKLKAAVSPIPAVWRLQGSTSILDQASSPVMYSTHKEVA